MPQDRGTGRNFGRVERAWASILRATMTRALLGATLGLAIGLSAPAYAADNTNDDNTNNSAWSKFMQTLGLKKPADSPDTTINYTERSPLVVPPSRDLPPPAAETAPPVPDWPKDPAKPAKRAKAKPGVVPATAVQTPNPPYEKKPWYNPIGWFDKEEYANFTGEPVRQDLTDPPAGYRIPSPDQPYGIAPDKKPGGKATQANPTAGQTVQSAPTGQPAPTAQPVPTAQTVPAGQNGQSGK
jgi:hypothetical protein